MISNTQTIILRTLVILVFLNLTVYLPGAGFFPFPAYFLDILIFVFILAFYLKNRLPLPVNNIFLLWLLYFFTLNIVYFIASPGGAEEFALLKVIIFLFFVYTYMLFLFFLDDENLTITRTTLIFLTPIVTITLGIDYFNPGYFSVDAGYEVVQGRAASFYRNANYAGSSLLIFLILAIDIVPKKFRTLFLLIVFFGIFFTMSRSNLISFFIIVLILFLQKKIFLRQMFISFSLISIFFVWISTSGLDLLSEQYNLKITENMKNRIDFFSTNESSDTSDMDERKEILDDALNLFTSSPIFGAGFGATLLWDHPVGPHNTFAMLWAEQGLFGLIFIPLLFFCSTYYIFKYGTKEQKQLAFLFMIAFSLSCLFAHDRLSTTTAIAFMTAISTIGYKMKILSLKKN